MNEKNYLKEGIEKKGGINPPPTSQKPPFNPSGVNRPPSTPAPGSNDH